MDLGSIFLILALLTVVALLVSRPLFNREGSPVFELSDREDHDYSTLLAERDRVIDAVEELDFDYSMGKIPEEDYPTQRTLLLQYGAEVLRKLDTFPAHNGKERANVKPAGDTVETRLETTVTDRRATRLVSAATVRTVTSKEEADDELEVLIASRRRTRQEKSAGFCSQCGGPVQKSDRFCPKCGATAK